MFHFLVAHGADELRFLPQQTQTFTPEFIKKYLSYLGLPAPVMDKIIQDSYRAASYQPEADPWPKLPSPRVEQVSSSTQTPVGASPPQLQASEPQVPQFQPSLFQAPQLQSRPAFSLWDEPPRGFINKDWFKGLGDSEPENKGSAPAGFPAFNPPASYSLFNDLLKW